MIGSSLDDFLIESGTYTREEIDEMNKKYTDLNKANDVIADLEGQLLHSQQLHGHCLDNAVTNAANMEKLDDMVDEYRLKYYEQYNRADALVMCLAVSWAVFVLVVFWTIYG